MISQSKDAIPTMILTAFVVTATPTFSKEALIQSQEWSARDFVPNRSVGAKDPLSAAAD